ncbi:MAG TPA: carbohydrate kinase [Solirubrobacteraceae bacterium]|nr:carbohydrate kinase [Solirubrobacteraceae bacterium]
MIDDAAPDRHTGDRAVRPDGDDAPRRGAIVVGGEALVDLVPDAEGRLVPHLGGGPFNVARTVARLGGPAAYLGPLSTDRFGVALRSALVADGVALDAAPSTDEPTTLALAELDADGAAQYRFYFDGTSAPGLSDATLPPDTAALCVGTLGLVLEPTARTLELLVARAPAETLVLLDPNVRPTTIADEDAYRARLERVLARADVVKASDADLAWLLPGEPPADAMRRLLARAGTSPAPVGLVTLGGDGALVVTLTDVAAVPAPPIDVVDTIGAGDAFAGGFLAWWHAHDLTRTDLHARPDAVLDATRFAVRVAALTCGRAGADPPHLTIDRA